MEPLTPELRDKLLHFHEVYEATYAQLIHAGPGGGDADADEWEVAAAAQAWKEALLASPLTVEQLRVYKLHVSIYLANGGELFSVPEGGR